MPTLALALSWRAVWLVRMHAQPARSVHAACVGWLGVHVACVLAPALRRRGLRPPSPAIPHPTYSSCAPNQTQGIYNRLTYDEREAEERVFVEAVTNQYESREALKYGGKRSVHVR